MKTAIRISSVSGLVVLSALAAGTALAQFEGVAEMKTTMEGGRVTASSKMFLGKPGYRMEMKLSGADMQKAGMGGMTMATLVKAAEPNRVYQINDATRSYSVMDLSKMKEQAAGQKTPDETYKVEKLGKDNVNGFSCDNARVTGSTGSVMEMCLTKDVAGSGQVFGALQGGSRSGSGDNLYKALRDSGVEGFPARMIVRDKSAKPMMTMELLKLEKRSLPASTFEVPAGYQEQTGMAGMAVNLPPEAQKQMREAMEKMTPEQRKMMEDAMKKAGQGGQ